MVKTLLLEPHITPAAAANDIDPELLRLLIAVRAAASEEAAAAEGDASAGGGSAGLVRCGLADVLALHDPGWQDPDLRDKITRACGALVSAAGAEAAAWLGSAEELAASAPRLNVNAHGLGAHLHTDGSSNSDLAVGLFPMLSMLNHSCRPNCAFVCGGDGGVMATAAVEDIREGEELTVAYIDLYTQRAARRAATLQTKGFECRCRRCEEPLSQSLDRQLQGALCRCGEVFVPQEIGRAHV